MIYFTSDQHYNHTNILRYCNRPFVDVNEMNRHLIDQYNAVVAPGDTVYHLGDFGFLPKEQADNLLSELHGAKILIKGNHDDKRVTKSAGWDEVCYDMKLEIEGVRIQLCHYPTPDKFKDWDMYLFGHVHGITQPTHNTLDVGVDHVAKLLGQYRPISLHEIVDILDSCPQPVLDQI